MSDPTRHLPQDEIERIAFSGASAPHLGRCARCQAAVARAKARKDLLRAIPPAELDELTFRRIESKLFAGPVGSAAGELQRAAWRELFAARWLVPAGFALAAALVAGLLALRAPQLREHTNDAPALAQADARPLLRAQATLVQGEVWFREDAQSPWQALAPGQPLGEKAQLRADDGQASIALAPGTGFVLEPRSELAIDSLREGRTHLSIESGRIACAVRPLVGDARFVVSAGPREVEVVGTAFAVAREQDDVLVEVQHGLVAVRDAVDPAQHTEVRGPGRLQVPHGDSIEPSRADAAPSPAVLAAERALLASSEWRAAEPSDQPLALLRFDGLPAGARVDVDGLGFAAAPWSGLLPPGRHRVSAILPGQPAQIGFVELTSSGVSAGPALLSAPSAPAPRPSIVRATAPQETVDPSIVAASIRQKMGELRGCYERWLKRDERAAGTIVLVLDIRADGGVERFSAKGLILPDETEDCFSRAASTWRLPGSGEPLELEVPLRLTANSP